MPFPKLLYWTSEGDASVGLAAFVRVMTRSGQPLAEFDLPEKFLPTASSGIRNNLAFESLTFGRNSGRLLTATETALVQDGPSASLTGGSPVRVLSLNANNGRAREEYIYVTDPVLAEPIPADAFATNGLVELLTVDKDLLIAVERAFSTGVGNTIRLFITTTRRATNVRRLESISGKNFRPMKKMLLFDLSELGLPLDNIEGVTFGPRITGDRTLITGFRQ